MRNVSLIIYKKQDESVTYNYCEFSKIYINIIYMYFLDHDVELVIKLLTKYNNALTKISIVLGTQ